MKEAMISVGFRLPSSHLKLLDEAAAQCRLSAGAYARQLVIQALTDETRLRLQSELAELRKGLEATRRDLATATVALLADAGRASAEEARAFVQKHMGD